MTAAPARYHTAGRLVENGCKRHEAAFEAA
jgi:hypothetical protein